MRSSAKRPHDSGGGGGRGSEAMRKKSAEDEVLLRETRLCYPSHTARTAGGRGEGGGRVDARAVLVSAVRAKRGKTHAKSNGKERERERAGGAPIRFRFHFSEVQR